VPGTQDLYRGPGHEVIDGMRTQTNGHHASEKQLSAAMIGRLVHHAEVVSMKATATGRRTPELGRCLLTTLRDGGPGRGAIFDR
jgi:hypothetical protein